MKFPFYNHASHHDTKPDLVVSLPGIQLPPVQESPNWFDICMVMEAKAVQKQDPFGKAGQLHADTAIQLSISARNLMFAHGFLFVFVFGIYGDVARIARFDRACAVVSPPIPYRTRPDILRRFFWRLVHPSVGHTVVGADPAIRRLTTEDVRLVREQLEAIEWDTADLSDAEMLKGRRVTVPEGQVAKDAPTRTFVLFDLLDVNARLFSRSTMVWLALEDRRDVKDATPPKVAVLKEAWHQIIRRPETEFYERLKHIPEDQRVGLPQMLCGVDYGEREVKEWRACGGILPRYGPDGEDPGPPVPSTQAAEAPPPDEDPVESSTEEQDVASHSMHTQDVDPLPSHDADPSPPLEYPLPYPQYQTHTWRLLHGDKHSNRERSLVRIVVDAVGRPLTRFRSTREMIEGFRDAIEGKRIFCDRFLARDLS